MLAGQGTAVNAGLPAALEWGFTATTLADATDFTRTTMLSDTDNAVQMSTDLEAIASTVWETTTSNSEKIDTQAV